MARALVLKRAGDPQGAAHSMEEARLLDGQDRFLNGKAAKYWLRAGNVSKAEELLVMFTKVSSTSLTGFSADKGPEGYDCLGRFDRDAVSLVLARRGRQLPS